MPNAERVGSPRPRPLLLVCIGTFLLAGLLRLSFAREVYRQWRTLPPDVVASDQISFITPDSPSYLTPARAVLDGQILSAGSSFRPPGYPIFLAALAVRYPVILGAQAMLGAAIAVGIVLAVYVVTRHVALAAASGFVSALSPTGFSLTGLIMPDVLFSVTVTAGIALLFVAGRQRLRWPLYVAGVAFGAGGLVKPMLLLWPPVAVAMLWLFAGGTLRPFWWRALVLFLTLQLAPMLLWSVRNRAVDGAFTLSSVGTITLRLYLMSRAEAWAAVGRLPTDEEMQQWRALAREAGRGDRTLADQLRMYREQSLTIAATHPKETALAYIRNTLENLVGGWSWLESQLPLRGAIYELARRATQWEKWARMMVPVLLIAVLLVTWRRGRVLGSTLSRQPFADACGLVMAWAYFVVLGGLAYWHGPRHMYPTSVAVLATMALGVVSFSRVPNSPESPN